ncbi:MAG TPA: ABC transporter substrate-binding protein [Pseudolabrys sp.]|nr:ABC transporter substrate-binding protein [Pseudolabrys sp.]
MSRRLVAAVAAAFSLFAFSAASAEPVTLRVNYSAIPPHLIPAIFMKKDLLKHEGKTYNVKFVFTRGSSIVMQALAANEMDLGVLSSIAFVHGIQNAHQPFRAIGDLVQDGPQFTSRFAVKKDSPIKTVEDFKGHSIAVNAFGGALDMAARLMLKKHGLVAGKDVTIVEAKFPAMHAMVVQGKVDAASFIAPFWYPAAKTGDIRPVFTMKQALGDSEFLFWVATEQTLKAKHAALVDFFEDYLRARRWFLDPKNRDEALALMAKAAKRPVSKFSWALSKDGYYRSKDLRIDKTVFQNTIDKIYEAGFIKQKFDATPYIDESVIKEAAARLK